MQHGKHSKNFHTHQKQSLHRKFNDCDSDQHCNHKHPREEESFVLKESSFKLDASPACEGQLLCLKKRRQYSTLWLMSISMEFYVDLEPPAATFPTHWSAGLEKSLREENSNCRNTAPYNWEENRHIWFRISKCCRLFPNAKCMSIEGSSIQRQALLYPKNLSGRHCRDGATISKVRGLNSRKISASMLLSQPK